MRRTCVENVNVAKVQSDFLTGHSLNLRLNRMSRSLKRCPVQETSMANWSHTACQLFSSHRCISDSWLPSSPGWRAKSVEAVMAESVKTVDFQKTSAFIHSVPV